MLPRGRVTANSLHGLTASPNCCTMANLPGDAGPCIPAEAATSPLPAASVAAGIMMRAGGAKGQICVLRDLHVSRRVALPGILPAPAVTGTVRLEASRRARAGVWLGSVGPGRAPRDSRWAGALETLDLDGCLNLGKLPASTDLAAYAARRLGSREEIEATVRGALTALPFVQSPCRASSDAYGSTNAVAAATAAAR